MLIPVICLCCGLILLAVFQYFRVKNISPFSTVLKSLTSAGFIAMALCPLALKDYDISARRYCVLFIMALVFGLLGDIFLDLKFVHPESSAPYTYAGFLVFLAGHIFYDRALILRYYIRGHILYIIVPVLVSLLFGVIVFCAEKPMKVRYGSYKAIVTAYSPFVISIAAFSCSFAILNSFRILPLNIFLGASVLFLISDFILNGTYFGEGKNRPVDIVTNHTAYYLAQYAFAFSLCFLS